MTLFDDQTLEKFPVLVGMYELPVEMCDERSCRMPPSLRAHATRLESLEYILDEGILPGGGRYGCPIWEPDVMPPRFKNMPREETILKCREDGVYFWDDYRGSTEQALVTVQHVRQDEPVVLITDVGGLELFLDPEMHEPDAESYDDLAELDPVAQFHEGAVSPERIKCVCALKDEFRFSTGQVLCGVNEPKNKWANCLRLDESGWWDTYEKLTDPDNWECFCKRPL